MQTDSGAFPNRYASAVCDLWCGEEGASVVEYALLLALIMVVVVAAVTTLGTKTSSKLADPTVTNALS